MNKELISLIDGVTPIVEIWQPESHAQIKWKQDWLNRARFQINQYLKEPKNVGC